MIRECNRCHREYRIEVLPSQGVEQLVILKFCPVCGKCALRPTLKFDATVDDKTSARYIANELSEER